MVHIINDIRAFSSPYKYEPGPPQPSWRFPDDYTLKLDRKREDHGL